MAQTRDYKLDRLRILSMILVICVHSANYYCRAISHISLFSFVFALFVDTLARVSVPIFFMISGAALLQKEYSPEKNRRRIIYRSITLIFTTCVFLLWDKLYMKKDIDLLSLLEQPERKLLWFLYAIIGIYIILPFIKRMVDGMTEREEKLFVILFMIFGSVVHCFNIKSKYPVAIFGSSYYLCYFVIGHILYKNSKKYDFSKHKGVKWAILIGCAAISTAILTAVFQKDGEFNSLYVSYRNIFILIESIVAFVLLYGILSDKKSKAVDTLASLSFGVYLFHGILLNVFFRLFPYKSVSPIVGIPLGVVAIFVPTAIAVFLLRKIPKFKLFF